jgi:hypothetical protein
VPVSVEGAGDGTGAGTVAGAEAMRQAYPVAVTREEGAPGVEAPAGQSLKKVNKVKLS